MFLMKRDMPAFMQKILLGFASGVMVAASVWSLIIPAIDMGEGSYAVVPPTIGLLAGFAFLLLIDYITPHIHISGEAEGPRSRLSRTAKLALAEKFIISLRVWRSESRLPERSQQISILQELWPFHWE